MGGWPTQVPNWVPGAEDLKKKYNKLNPSEQKQVDNDPLAANKANELADKAMQVTKNKFPNAADRHNGPGDAFRHCYWNALMAREIGERAAEAIATAHEDGGGPANERLMDLHNNSVGRLIGSKHPNENDYRLTDLCMEAVDTGQTMILDKNGKLIPSGSKPNPNGPPPQFRRR